MDFRSKPTMHISKNNVHRFLKIPQIFPVFVCWKAAKHIYFNYFPTSELIKWIHAPKLGKHMQTHAIS